MVHIACYDENSHHIKKKNNCVPFEVYNKKKQHLFKAFDDGLKEQTKQTVYIIKLPPSNFCSPPVYYVHAVFHDVEICQ